MGQLNAPKKEEKLNICVYFVKKTTSKKIKFNYYLFKILRSKFFVDIYQKLVEKYARYKIAFILDLCAMFPKREKSKIQIFLSWI